jgi:Domain of unknown function (DUF4375)
MPAIPPDAIVVSRNSFDSDDAYAPIQSNISFINAQLDQWLRPDEIAADAMCSYYVDFYVAQVENGGFAQFVYNCNADPVVLDQVGRGLQAMRAPRHAALYAASRALLEQMDDRTLQAFMDGDYFDHDPARDALARHSEAFYALAEQEDLVALNSAWLRTHPHLVVLSIAEMQAEVERRAATLPDRAARVAAALENEPRYMKLIRCLCADNGHTLDRITAGDPGHEHNGRQVLAWYFLTDRGHYYLLDLDGVARMHAADSHALVAQIEAPTEHSRASRH